ncbi:unnamed protein product [Chrysodeixis includens]|uniref:Alpha 1,4-glycosyltransferase domain-containing protein n=1 Tax=Chrysodeixis includens TaxID=689277 RepID=A0A9N8KU71_CHRIL|nr:unnamed protein product [Chrysodeixis includens]
MYLLYDLSGYPGSSYNVPRKHSVDTSCHYAEHDDALEAADGNYSLPLRSIFFIETSCRGGLNSRQACSVESAARAHPQWQITVFFLAPVCEDNLNHTCLRTLGQLGNVKFVRIKIKEFTQNTLLEPLIHENHLQNTSYPIENFSNALRYLILYKWGGIYLDTDMIVVKDLSALGANWVGKEDPGSLNSAAMRISSDVIGRRFATGLLDEFKYEYSVRMRGMNGPQVITRVLEEYWCHLYKPQHWNPRTCKVHFFLVVELNRTALTKDNTPVLAVSLVQKALQHVTSAFVPSPLDTKARGWVHFFVVEELNRTALTEDNTLVLAVSLVQKALQHVTSAFVPSPLDTKARGWGCPLDVSRVPVCGTRRDTSPHVLLAAEVPGAQAGEAATCVERLGNGEPSGSMQCCCISCDDMLA